MTSFELINKLYYNDEGKSKICIDPNGNALFSNQKCPVAFGPFCGNITPQSGTRNLFGGTPAGFGAFNANQGGDINTLMYLLNLKGIDVNMERTDGHTLLHAACENFYTLPVDFFFVLHQFQIPKKYPCF